MSIFNVFRKTHSRIGRNAKSLDYRRFKLESLEDRCLLSVNPGLVDYAPAQTADEFDIDTCIAITTEVPTATQVDEVNSITEANPGDTVYVSVYVKSTDPSVGITGGYCSLYYDVEGFTPGDYTPSAIFPEQTRNDEYDYSKDNYISVFGGNPSSMTATYGKTQWALTGTQAFTVADDAEGDYTFSNGLTRNKKGVEKESFGYIRSDLGQVSAYKEVTLTVKGGTPATGPVEACISVTSAIPTATQVDSVETLTEVAKGDTVYVSVYVKSTDSNYGIQGGYSTLYYDAAGFTAGEYTESAIFNESTYNDGYAYPGDGYISTFGGFPTSMTAAYGQTQWALVGTFSFTADAAGEYTFSTGMARNAKGNEKESWGYVREDFAQTEEYGNPVATLSIVVTGDTPTPDITDVTVTGIEKVYDGGFYSIAVEDPEAATDTIFFSEDGVTYDLTVAPAYSNVGTYTTYVKVSREGYNDFYSSADVVITPANISGVELIDTFAVYDGNAYSIEVTGTQDGDVVTYSLDAETYDLTENPSFTEISGEDGYQVFVKVSRANYNDWYGGAGVYIDPKTLTVEGTVVANKEFDGTTDADITMGTVSGIVAGDNVTVTIASGAFGSADPGFYDVTVTYAAEGEDAHNYVVENSVVKDAYIYSSATKVIDSYTIDFNSFGLEPTFVVVDGVQYMVGELDGTEYTPDDVFNDYTNGFGSLKNLAGYSGLYDFVDGNSVTIDVASIAPGIDDTDEGITLWRDDVDGEFTQVWTGDVVGYNFGGATFVKEINVVGNTTWDNQATIYVGDQLDINYNNNYSVNTLSGAFVDGIPADDDADGPAATGNENSVVNINSAGKDINLSMANYDGENVFTGDFNVVANKADFSGFRHTPGVFDEFGDFSRTGFLNLGSGTNVEQLFIKIGDTIKGLTTDTEAAVRLAEGGRIGELMVEIDAFFLAGPYENTLAVDNFGTIDVFNFQTASSVYATLQSIWPVIMPDDPVLPTEQELYYYYYDGETAESNPFDSDSDARIQTFLSRLQSGSAQYKALAAAIIARMKGMHEVAGVTTLYVVNNESGVIDEGLDKLWGFGGGVSFENYGVIGSDVDSTDGQGADYFLNYGGTTEALAFGSTDDTFVTGGGAVKGKVEMGAGDDVVTVFDTTVFGTETYQGELAFGDGEDALLLYGSAYGEDGTYFCAVFSDMPESIVIYDVADGRFSDSKAETTVTIVSELRNTDVTLDFSLVEAQKYGDYGVVIGPEGSLSEIEAYTVCLDADTVLGNGDGKVVIFSGATRNNFNMSAEFTFKGDFDTATLVIDGTDRLVIGNYEYELLYDGTHVYLQRAGEPGKADLYVVSVTAVDKFTGDVLVVDGGVLTPDNAATVTVTFGNKGDAAVANKTFYSAVRLKNADTGEYITLNPGKDWYERLCPGEEAVGETGEFSFQMPRLAVGNYTIEIQLNNRGTVVESNYEDDYKEVNFSVALSGSNLMVSFDSFSAVDEDTGEVLDIYHGGIENTSNARVTVTFWNIAEKDVDVEYPSGTSYFYNEVRVRDEDGNYYVMDSTGRWYERIIIPGYVAGNGGEASFDFLMPQLEAGKYYIEVVLDHRLVTDDVDRSNNTIDFEFEVTEHVPTYALELLDAAATGRTSGDVVELVDGAEIESEINDVVVTFKNVSGRDIDAPYVYGGVKLQDSEGNYILGSEDGWYERLTYEGLGEDETGSFKFTMKALEAGDYTMTLAIDQRCAIGDVADIRTINFTVKSEVVTQCDMVNTGISAIDKITGNAYELDSFTTAVLPVFTVTYKNQGADANKPFFYSSVQVVKEDGTVVLKTYERYCNTGLLAGEEGSFNFTIGRQAAGTYTVKVQLDNREALDQSDFDNDYVEYQFTVADASAAELPGLFADEAFVDDLFVDF